MKRSDFDSPHQLTRRHFISGTATAVSALTFSVDSSVRAADVTPKINWGLIGCGGRGSWIANLFQSHGGYNLVAVADYFEDRADSAGEKFHVPADCRFTGLSAYKRLLEQKLDAVVIETPPYFHPEQAAAAVDAGKHVYVAKPIAVDVPGCATILDSGRRARDKKLSFLIDFQTRAHPAYQEVVRRVSENAIGRIVSVEANYQTSTMFANLDASLRADPHNRELRLRAWVLDCALSGDIITEQNIHALDVATWFLNAAPVRAYGTCGRAREFLGECRDHFAVIYNFPNDVTASFSSKQVGQNYEDIMCRVYGLNGTADTHYGGEVTLRAGTDEFKARTDDLYKEGAVRNIATFYENVTKGNCANPTVEPSVRSNLTTILGRTAAYRNREVTWAELMKANEKIEFDTKGLKA
jgi:myo-inositol 2-dehydrogenase / D-chiro-inositol 1-dehydrogenase